MRHPFGAAVLLIMLVVALYAPTIGYGFVYEDFNDPERFLAPPTLDGMRQARWPRIVTTWTFGVSGWLTPMAPAGYHAVSVAVHALNSVLLFGLARMVWGGLWTPFICALLFAVHPIQTEAVAYISARADVVMTTGVILALLCAERERWGLMLVACLVAVGAKESGIVAAPLALLWAMGRSKPLPLWLLSLAAVSLGIGSLLLIGLYDLPRCDLRYTAQETAKLWHLLGKIVLPVGLSIDHDYSHWPAAWPMVTVMGTLALGCYAMISTRPWAFGVLFTLIALAPRLLVPLVEGLHEHHLYVCTVGLSLAVIGMFQREQYGISEALSQA